MEILVDNEKLDFTLENEKTLHDVISFLENWLIQKNTVISLINVDGIEITPNMSQTLKNMELDKIVNVNIITTSQTEIAFTSLQDASKYIDIFLDEIENERNTFNEKKDEKIEGLNWLSDIVFSSCNVLGVNISALFYNESNLEEIIAFLALSAAELEKKKHDDDFFYDYFVTGIKDKLISLKNILPSIFHQAVFQSQNHRENQKISEDNILEILKSLKNNIYFMSPILENISENFQSGKDLEALIGIKKISSLLDSLINSIKHIEYLLGLNYANLFVQDKSIEDINKNLLDVLTKIFNAFQNKDMVLLADLIEYELSEYFELFKGVLETLIIITNQKKMVN